MHVLRDLPSRQAPLMQHGQDSEPALRREDDIGGSSTTSEICSHLTERRADDWGNGELATHCTSNTVKHGWELGKQGSRKLYSDLWTLVSENYFVACSGCAALIRNVQSAGQGRLICASHLAAGSSLSAEHIL